MRSVVDHLKTLVHVKKEVEGKSMSNEYTCNVTVYYVRSS